MPGSHQQRETCPHTPEDERRPDRGLGASGQTGIIDGTEISVRRPAAGRKGRNKFVSGKAKQNAVTSMVLTDADGRVLYYSPV
ncbi:hypothetical protein J2Z21_009562 [Streptomyces griseochromogenes]|uniref:DDE Tnp4 domain-containing protein n=1 Tax=Streptomyces griseochromogenes TaxID=68214 RepID=A0ABS4MA54_9ACTN|nr:hypothetical protein [Streptomyces griseochromogenes]MBP2056543.1 hypothetical protein [Streptomyces griseochromogenes]